MGSIIQTYSVELVRDSSKVYDVERAITSPEAVHSVVEAVLGLSKKTQEHFVVLSLNTKNVVIGVHTLHIGTVNASIVHPRDVFQRAILNNATSIIICHNHPSGDLTPSQEDIDVTKRIQASGDLLGIEMLDHIIIGDGFLSLKEGGHF